MRTVLCIGTLFLRGIPEYKQRICFSNESSRAALAYGFCLAMALRQNMIKIWRFLFIPDAPIGPLLQITIFKFLYDVETCKFELNLSIIRGAYKISRLRYRRNCGKIYLTERQFFRDLSGPFCTCAQFVCFARSSLYGKHNYFSIIIACPFNNLM